MRYNAFIVSNTKVNDNLAIVRVTPNNWLLPPFVPGQFAMLGLCGDKLVKRAYSIASPQCATEYLEFCISLVPEGGLTPKLWLLQTGDEIWLSDRVYGRFTLDRASDGDVLLVATGTGIAPYMSMIRSKIHERRGTVTLIRGVRHIEDLVYHSELLTLEHIFPHFRYRPIISRPMHCLKSIRSIGHVQDVYEEVFLDMKPEKTHVFLCGNPDMIRDVQANIQDIGFAGIYKEKHWG